MPCDVTLHGYAVQEVVQRLAVGIGRKDEVANTVNIGVEGFILLVLWFLVFRHGDVSRRI